MEEKLSNSIIPYDQAGKEFWNILTNISKSFTNFYLKNYVIDGWT